MFGEYLEKIKFYISGDMMNQKKILKFEYMLLF